jgi:hypothetical protein
MATPTPPLPRIPVGANMPAPTLRQPLCSQNHRDSRPTANGMMICRHCGWLR